MKYLLAAVLCLTAACATAPVVQEAPPPPPEPAVAEAAPAERQFCDLAASDALQIEQELAQRNSGLDVSIDVTSCSVFAETLGKATFLVHAYVSGNLIYDMEVVRIMGSDKGKWVLLKEGPMYVIDYVQGKVSWFIEQPFQKADSGPEI